MSQMAPVQECDDVSEPLLDCDGVLALRSTRCRGSPETQPCARTTKDRGDLQARFYSVFKHARRRRVGMYG